MAQPVWTGSSWDYSIPDSIKQSQIGQYWNAGGNIADTREGAMAAAVGGSQEGYSGAINQFYGFNDPTLAKWSPLGHNYASRFNSDGTLAGLEIKSGDKQGTFVPFTRDEAGNYTPDYSKKGNTSWDTNTAGETAWGIASVIGAGLGAGLGAEALGIAGAQGAGAGLGLGGGAVGGTELGAGAGLLGDVTPAAGTVGYGATPGIEGVIAGGAGGTAGGGGAALEGLGGVEPISTSGFSTEAGGIGSYGAGPETALQGGNWYDSLIPDWKDLVKQGVKQYMGQQSQGGGGGGGAAGGGGFGGGGAGPGSRMTMIPGTQDVQGTWKPNQLPMGGLLPPGATNPVSDAANTLALTLAKQRGLYG